MTHNVTSGQPAIEGRTVYVLPDPAGLGGTLGRALDALPDATRIVLCGDRIGNRAGVLDWIERRGDWCLLRDPYVKRRDLDIEAATPSGRRVRVTSAEPWFGEGCATVDAAEAMRYVRRVCSQWDTYPVGRPFDTGRKLLRSTWERHGHGFPACPPEVAELLTSTSGQGRFEVFPAGAPEVGVYPAIWSVDARFMYASCARSELPVGDPVEVKGAPADPFAASWCRVRWTPAEGLPIGLLPYHDEQRWRWPTFGGWEGWCSGAELHLARQHGYRIEVERSIVWPSRSNAPLRAFAELVDRHREKLTALPLSPGAVEAGRNALRAVLIGTIGSLHQTATIAPVDSSERMMKPRREPDPDAADSAGVGLSFVRPEWTTAIWALARYRLARVMLDQTAPVIGCTLDGFYVGGRPVLPEDRGRAGSFIVKGSTQWPEPIRHQRELYEMAATIRPER